LVGRWLLARAGVDGHERVGVPVDTPAGACAQLGARLAADPRRLALLVLGDGSYCRGLTAPGYDDPRAAGYDGAVARALTRVDTAALLSLDGEISAQLGVAGRAPWQVLAGAVEATGGNWRGRLHYHAAPYGVAYLVATWAVS
jgi:aromatic ring-opening dioxygenase LigB subunit